MSLIVAPYIEVANVAGVNQPEKVPVPLNVGSKEGRRVGSLARRDAVNAEASADVFMGGMAHSGPKRPRMLDGHSVAFPRWKCAWVRPWMFSILIV